MDKLLRSLPRTFAWLNGCIQDPMRLIVLHLINFRHSPFFLVFCSTSALRIHEMGRLSVARSGANREKDSPDRSSGLGSVI